MLKQHPTFVKQLIATIDILLVIGAFFASHRIVSHYKTLHSLQYYFLMPAGFMAFYLYFAWTRQLFSILDFSWMRGLYKRVVVIFLSAGGLGAAILYLLPDAYNSRTLYIVFASFSFILIYTEKYTLMFLIGWVRKKNHNITPVILFGRGRLVAQINKEILSHPEWGLRIRNMLDIGISRKAFENVLKTSYVEEVFFCIPRSATKDGFRIDQYLQICEEMGRTARVFVNIWTVTRFAQWKYHDFMEYPTFISQTVELDPDQIIFKRIFDICGSIIGMVALFIVYPFLALVIKLTSPGPVFFRQVRVGKNGKRFVIYKFRSMTFDAEDKKHELEAENECNGAVFKIQNDPRVTPIGRVIRKFSLDELPQFINVLKGEMSLVGTRPPTPDEVSQYERWHHRRISIKPGITGMWQAGGRNTIKDFDEIVRLDLQYIDSWSIWLDMNILFKTFFIVFKRNLAY